MGHAVVHWEFENMFSVVSTKKIQMDSLDGTNSLEELIGKTAKIFWKRKLTDGTVLAIGSKSDMEKEEAAYLTRAAELSFEQKDLNDSDIEEENEVPPDPCQSKRIRLINNKVFGAEYVDPNEITGMRKVSKSKTLTSQSQLTNNILESNENIISQMVDADHDLQNSDDISAPMDAKDLEILQLKQLLAEKSAEAARYKGLLKKNLGHNHSHIPEEMGMIDIGGGVEISNNFLCITKAMYESKPSLYMKRLVYDSGIFYLEYVASCSLSGHKAAKGPEVQRPALDPLKISAMKNYVIQQCQLDLGTVARMEFELTLKNLCTDARKKLKNIKTTSETAN